MRNFTFSLPTKIIFGRGQVRELGDELKERGASRVLICYGSNRIKENGLFDTVTLMIERAGIDWSAIGGVRPNPRIELVRQAVKKCKVEGVDYILAIGGGSVIDTAKAVAAGVFVDEPWDLFEGKITVEKALPVASILTLAATGSEMNGNAVISNPKTVQKNAIYSPLLRPKFSILDPIFTYTVPPYHTAAGVADIMSHCFEQYFSREDHAFLTDRMTEAVLKTCVHYGPIALKRGDDYEVRSNLLWAGSIALNDILSIGKTGDWACHQIEHAISAMTDAIHGAGLAVLFPKWMETVLDEDNVPRFKALAQNVYNVEDNGNDWETAEQAISQTAEFFKSLGLPDSLKEFGISMNDIDKIAEKVCGNSTIGTFQVLDKEKVKEILIKAL